MLIVNEFKQPFNPTESQSTIILHNLDVGSRSMKSVLLTNPYIVYERLFENSLPQKERNSYFLTEVYNIKDLIRHKNFVEKGQDITIKSCSLKCDSSNEKIEPYYKLASPEDTTLLFESKFESGNLCLATKVSEWEYNVFMQNDINTQGYTQWFYFRVTYTRAGSSVNFNIVNFVNN